MTTATSGRRREYLVRDHLEAAGYPFIMRAAASKGAADLLHGHAFVGAVLVQVGTGGKRMTCGLKDCAHETANGSAEQCGRNRFCEAADLCHALPLLATVVATRGKRTEITYWVVTRGVPSSWERWTP